MAEILVERADLLVTRDEPAAQLVLHCEPADAPALAAAAGLALPGAMLRAETTAGWRALHLAPDEWLLVGPAAERDRVVGRIEAAAAPCSLVDVGERGLTLRVEGGAATTLLNAGCPLDLGDRAFPPGACTRTLFGKATVVLERSRDADCFRMQYGRSFDGYVIGLIRAAATDLPEARPS